MILTFFLSAPSYKINGMFIKMKRKKQTLDYVSALEVIFYQTNKLGTYNFKSKSKIISSVHCYIALQAHKQDMKTEKREKAINVTLPALESPESAIRKRIFKQLLDMKLRRRMRIRKRN